MKSLRTADFELYKQTLDNLMPWVFAMDRTHYCRALSVHLRDMATLEEVHPDLYIEFKDNGHFVGQKTRKAFSKIPHDQMHEQMIDWLKNTSGVIDNLDDPSKVRRELVVCPEMVRLIHEFEDNDETEDQKHHEQYRKFQEDYKVPKF